ncbi:hypothetical protein [Antrihabitans cavernicola]|uniref:Integral membrane protein n=1 Tax=Antrihabitans cavernicola TaxID=2495913 RepID=A0A5A7SBK7_9NOCA|nr:hypothetical protein [Spelaeibacter cavernicola]KAA0022227.1 hypothetical protein FOY51_14675 [Spelaeibacter cavernicola]
MKRLGPGDVLLFCYGVFVIAAASRSIVQLALHASHAPVAYAFSALAAVVYGVGYAALRAASRDPTAVPLARTWCAIELVAVVAVGTLSVLWSELFPDDTVWSGYGHGYGFVPLALPVLSLVWLRGVGAED